MQTIYFKVTIPELPEALRVSINSSMLVKATPQKQLEFVRKQAAKRGLSATYELATEAEYWEHRAFVKAQIAAAK